MKVKCEKCAKQDILSFFPGLMWHLPRFSLTPRGISAVRKNEIADVLPPRNKELKHAWDHCRSSGCSLVARIFRIPRHLLFHSRCPSCRPDITRLAFHETQHSRRLERQPKSDGSPCSGDRRLRVDLKVESLRKTSRFSL